MAGYDDPEVFGRYVLERKLSDSGVCELFQARLADPSGPSMRLCVKRLKPHMADEKVFARAFGTTAPRVADVDHPAIANVFEVGGSDLPFAAVELIDGIDLGELVAGARRQGAGVPLPVQVAVISRCADALAAVYCHESDRDGKAGTIHGGLSPGNIRIGRDGSIRLLDFGLAAAALRSPATPIGYVRAKLPYTAPEVVRGGMADARTDVYALGVLAFELAALRLPHLAASEFELMGRICGGATPSISDVKPDLPAALAEVIDRALSVEPEERQADAAAFGAQFARTAPAAGGASASVVAAIVERTKPASAASLEREEAVEDTPGMPLPGRTVVGAVPAVGDVAVAMDLNTAHAEDRAVASPPFLAVDAGGGEVLSAEKTVVDLRLSEALGAGGTLLDESTSAGLQAAGGRKRPAAGGDGTAATTDDLSIVTLVGERVPMPAQRDTLGNTETKTVGGGNAVPVPRPPAAPDGVAPGEGDTDLDEGTMIVTHVGQLEGAPARESSRPKGGPSRMAVHPTDLASVPRARRSAATVIAGAVAVAMLVATLIWALGATGDGGEAEAPVGPGALGAGAPEPGGEAAAAGVVRLTSMPATEIAWRGQTLGVTPIDLEFPAGTHRLTVTQRALDRVSTILVRVAPGARITRSIDLQSATLTVLTTPNADATLDGVKVGPTPLTRLHVEPGEHVVELFEPRSAIRKKIPVTIRPSHDHEMTLDISSGR